MYLKILVRDVQAMSKRKFQDLMDPRVFNTVEF